MASVNRVILVGNLGRDPEVRYAPSGDAITNITVATTDQWKDKSGEKQERTEWHRVVFFGRQAEIAGEYLKKGSQVYIEGSLRTRKWTDQAGQERYTTEIVADHMQMLGAKSSGNNGDDQGGASQGSNAPQQGRQNQQRLPVISRARIVRINGIRVAVGAITKTSTAISKISATTIMTISPSGHPTLHMIRSCARCRAGRFAFN